MPQQRDNRYRGRQRQRTALPRRKPGHLRTNYTSDDVYLFRQDLEKVRAVWPQDILAGDRKAQRTMMLRITGVTTVIVMVPVTVFAIVGAVKGGMPWWMVPVIQSAALLYILVMNLFNRLGNRDEDIDLLIYREADRRAIKYQKGKTPLYNIMNRINYDYNCTLWNRNFKWK